MMYIARCSIELLTPLHCGGGEGDGLLDAPVTRDALGLWRILGSSLAGIFRSHILKTFGEKMESALFGTRHGAESNTSLVWCSDAVLLDFDQKVAWKKLASGEKTLMPELPSFIRDHVRIDTGSGTAANSGKFDAEYVPAGTRFAFEISLNGWQNALSDELVQGYAALIGELEGGHLRFGGKAGNGYGQYVMHSLQCRHFPLHTAESMSQWLNLNDDVTFDDACGEIWQAGKSDVPDASYAAHDAPDSLCGELSIALAFTGPILIGGGSSDAHSDADMCFATTAYCDYENQAFINTYTLPGSSLKGILRHRVRYIAATLGMDADTMVNELFGHIEKDRTAHNAQQAKKGRVMVRDALLCRATDTPVTKQVQHVAIDRFTGGAVDACLYSEAPVWTKDIGFNLHVRVEELTDVEAALLLHALMDMAQGKVAVGSGGNRGNGRMCVKSNAQLHCHLSWQGEQANQENTEILGVWLARLQTSLTKYREGTTC